MIKVLAIPTLAASLLALTACGASTPSGTRLIGPDAALTKPCDRPVDLTRYVEDGIMQADAEKYWRIDRAALVRCGGRQAELVTFIDDLFTRIGEKK